MRSKEYRKFYEDHHNFLIPFGYDIHHLDHNRKNNEISNLVCIPSNLHRSYHWHKRYYEYLVEEFLDEFSEEVKKMYESYYKRKIEYKSKLEEIINKINSYKIEKIGDM